MLGINALPSLGITVLRHNGEPILSRATGTSEPKLEPQVARVSLVDSVVISGQKGHYLKAHIDCDGPVADVLFEPHYDSLNAL